MCSSYFIEFEEFIEVVVIIAVVHAIIHLLLKECQPALDFM